MVLCGLMEVECCRNGTYNSTWQLTRSELRDSATASRASRRSLIGRCERKRMSATKPDTPQGQSGGDSTSAKLVTCLGCQELFAGSRSNRICPKCKSGKSAGRRTGGGRGAWHRGK